MLKRSTGFAALLLLTRVGLGHDTWIRPDNARVAPGQTVLLEATSGMAFPKLESPIAPDRIAQAGYRVAGGSQTISERRAGQKALELAVRPNSPGILVAWLETKPRAIDLTRAQVEEYLEEIGTPEILAEWKRSGVARWHETYTKHAKTFVRVGDGGTDRTWSEAAGMALEIVPQSDPTALRAGQELSVVVLREGRPLPAFPLVLVAAGRKTGSLVKTDTEGKARLRIGRKGWWLIKGTELKRSEGREGDWESHFTTVTLFVQ